MERLNFGDRKIIFSIILCIVNVGLMTSGRAAWQEEEETRKDFYIVLILRSNFEQSTDSILSACGSCGQRTQGS